MLRTRLKIGGRAGLAAGRVCSGDGVGVGTAGAVGGAGRLMVLA